uniref:CCHC-type domain-containing protein n=1 Tax=Rhizophagus irregularis (strain DAOM 181602 / DAOM 197198 / MUCL 43194) TaxID=747089 RepID=U9UW13_RHIID
MEYDKIILAYIADKEAKHEADTQLTNTDSNNVVKLSNKHVYNIDDIKDPLVHHAFNEENKVDVKRKRINVSCEKGDIEVNGNTGGHKCGICHKMGHYAPKCPSKENYR